MSGDSEAPPTYYFSGITFNPDFYQSSSENYLTYETAKSSFLTYPSAQGTETITTLNSSSINSSSEASDLSIVPSQTSGILNIGTGARLTSGNGGGINIGTGSGAVANPITIGGASSAIAINGPCTFAKQISASLGMTSAGNIAVTATSGTITAPSGGFLIGPYKNAATSSASISSAGAIDGASLALGTGAISTVGAITSTGTISTTGKITCSQVDSATATTEMSIGSNLSTANLTLGSGLGTGSIIIGKNNGAHQGEIRIGATQTSGIMNIATGSTRTGNLNICNTSGATNTINIGVIGTSVNIEGSLIKIGATQVINVMEIATSSTRTGAVFFCSTTGQTNSIYIGATGTKTILDGEVSILKPLTLPVATTTPTSTQLGYFTSNNNNTEITVSATNSTPSVVTNLAIGIYLFSYSVISYTPTIGASQVMTYSVTTTGGATSSIANYVFNGVATTFQDTQNLVGVVKATTAINSVVLNLIITSGGGTIKASQYGYNYIKIA